MSTVAARLRRALEKRGMSIREFQREIAKTDADGTSYPAVHRALQGKPVPSIAFLEAAAPILGVRPTWLILDDGPMTEGEAQTAHMTTIGTRQRELARKRVRNILRAAGIREIIDDDYTFDASPHAYVPYWAGALGELIGRVRLGEMLRVDPGLTQAHEDTGTADKSIGRALGLPLKAFGFDPNEIDDDAIGEYIMVMLPALLWMANEMQAPRDRRPAIVLGRGTREMPDAALRSRKPPGAKRKT